MIIKVICKLLSIYLEVINKKKKLVAFVLISVSIRRIMIVKSTTSTSSKILNNFFKF